jgi:hypothetical protein
MMETKVKLTPWESKVARRLGQRRYEAARKAGVKDKKIGDQSHSKTDEEGMGAEIAFAKLVNVYPDLDIKTRSGGHDCIIKGLTCDVKQTDCPNGHLLATLKKLDYQCNIYVLMVGLIPSFEFVGWATASELMRKENIKDLGHGKGYAMSWTRLRGPRSLLDPDWKLTDVFDEV